MRNIIDGFFQILPVATLLVLITLVIQFHSISNQVELIAAEVRVYRQCITAFSTGDTCIIDVNENGLPERFEIKRPTVISSHGDELSSDIDTHSVLSLVGKRSSNHICYPQIDWIIRLLREFLPETIAWSARRIFSTTPK